MNNAVFGSCFPETYPPPSMSIQSFESWRFFGFLILYSVGRTPWTGDQPVARPLHTLGTTQTQNKRTQTSMPWVGFEPTILVFERTKKVHALDRAATVIGWDLTGRTYFSFVPDFHVLNVIASRYGEPRELSSLKSVLWAGRSGMNLSARIDTASHDLLSDGHKARCGKHVSVIEAVFSAWSMPRSYREDSATSTVTLRVVGGEEKGSLEPRE
jgi:hypothetical protein